MLSKGSPDWGCGPRPTMNEGTRVKLQASLQHEPFDPAPWMRAIFEHLRRFLVLSGDRPGVMVVVGDRSAPHTIHGAKWLQPGEDPVHVIIGRHSRCAIRVPAEREELSLRHLAVLVHWSDFGLQVDVRDLETASGFTQEAGEKLRAVALSGSAFFSIGDLGVAIIETGHMAPVDDADAFYQSLPPRHFVEAKRGLDGQRRMHGEAEHEREQGATRVVSLPRSVYLKDLPTGGRPLGTLRLWEDGVLVERVLTDEAFARGVLIGRYPRCSLPWDGSDRVSRVHLLLSSIDEDLWVFDTASTNGLQWRRADGEWEELPYRRLQDGDRLCFGTAQMEWQASVVQGESESKRQMEGPRRAAPRRPTEATRYAPVGVVDPFRAELLAILERNAGLMVLGALARAVSVSESILEGHLDVLRSELQGVELQIDPTARVVQIDVERLRDRLD